jgi:hypothetical protein
MQLNKIFNSDELEECIDAMINAEEQEEMKKKINQK